MLSGRLVDDVADHAPDFDVHAFGHFDLGEGFVFRDQPDFSVSLVEALDREFSVHDRDDDAPVPRRFRAVDDEQVAVDTCRRTITTLLCNHTNWSGPEVLRQKVATELAVLALLGKTLLALRVDGGA
jgi:hypothetical protein